MWLSVVISVNSCDGKFIVFLQRMDDKGTECKNGPWILVKGHGGRRDAGSIFFRSRMIRRSRQRLPSVKESTMRCTRRRLPSKKASIIRSTRRSMLSVVASIIINLLMNLLSQ